MRDHANFRSLRKIFPPSVFIIIILSVIALNGRGESIPQTGAFIFIEIKPPSTSQDATVKSTAVYLNEKGLVQRYACEDDNIKELQEGSLPVAGANIFKTLSAISLKSLPGRQEADPNLPPSQAHPGHARIMVRQSGGAEHLWEGNADNIPAGLQKLVQDSSALAETLKAKKTPACNLAAADSIAGRPAGAFVRANVLSADRLDEYRVFKLLKTVKTLNELDPVLQDALVNPYCMISVPEGKNPFSTFAGKGASSPPPLLFNGTGYEVSRYSVAPGAPPPGP